MPRSNRPRRATGRPAAGTGPPREAVGEIDFEGQRWSVRMVRGNDSGRGYRCPGCQHEVSAAVPHTVVWPRESMLGVDNRRHWHTPCWSARERRRPGGSFA